MQRLSPKAEKQGMEGKKNQIKSGTRLLYTKEPSPGSVTARVAVLCKTQKSNFCLSLATLPKAVLLTSKFCSLAMPVGQMSSKLKQQDDLPGSFHSILIGTHT